jgi:HAD superfamily hydrolase (TIGR01509 family)
MAAAQTGALPVDAYWQAVAQRLHLDTEALSQLAQDFYSGDRLDTNLIAYINTLRQNGHPVALLSNDSPALKDRLRDLGIDHLFDPLVISAFIGCMKPDPAAYRAVLQGRPPQEAIFVDDLPANIDGARTLGMQAVLYTAGMDLPAALAAHLR